MSDGARKAVAAVERVVLARTAAEGDGGAPSARRPVQVDAGGGRVALCFCHRATRASTGPDLVIDVAELIWEPIAD